MSLLDTLKTLFGGSSSDSSSNNPKPDPTPERKPTPPSSPSDIDKLVIEFLKSQGLMPETLENGDTVFKYQMLTFIYFSSKNDTEFIHMALPGIHDFTDDTRSAVLEVINKLNFQLKVAKLIATDDDVWVSAEGMIDSTPNLEDFVPRMLDLLTRTRDLFYKELQ